MTGTTFLGPIYPTIPHMRGVSSESFQQGSMLAVLPRRIPENASRIRLRLGVRSCHGHQLVRPSNAAAGKVRGSSPHYLKRHFFNSLVLHHSFLNYFYPF